MTSAAEIQVLYFAALREAAKRESETVALTEGDTAAAVYQRPAARAFALRRQPPVCRVGHRPESRRHAGVYPARSRRLKCLI